MGPDVEPERDLLVGLNQGKPRIWGCIVVRKRKEKGWGGGERIRKC